MVAMIAKQTIGRSEVSRKPGTNGPLDPGAHRGVTLAPGAEFDVAEDEAKALEASGAAERKSNKPKPEEPATIIAVAENTAPRGPASGAISAPDPNQVAERSKAGGEIGASVKRGPAPKLDADKANNGG